MGAGRTNVMEHEGLLRILEHRVNEGVQTTKLRLETSNPQPLEFYIAGHVPLGYHDQRVSYSVRVDVEQVTGTRPLGVLPEGHVAKKYTARTVTTQKLSIVNGGNYPSYVVVDTVSS